MICVAVTPALRASLRALPCGSLAPCERTPFYEAFSKYHFQPTGLSVAAREVSLPSMQSEAPRPTLFWPRAAGRGGGFGRAYLNVLWIDDVRLTGGCWRKNSSERMRRLHRRRAPYELPAAKSSASE